MLTERQGSREAAVRYAVLRTYRETVIDQAQADSRRLRDDPADRAEMAAIVRFIGL